MGFDVCFFATQHISARYCPPLLCRNWQKDLRRSTVPIEDMAKHACLEAETENGETSDTSGVSSDPILNDFMGVKDALSFLVHPLKILLLDSSGLGSNELSVQVSLTSITCL